MDYEQALDICRNSPQTAARMLVELAAAVQRIPGIEARRQDLESENTRLRKRVDELEQQLAKNSRNAGPSL